MDLSFAFFSDPALTTRVTSLYLVADVNSAQAVDRVIYFGSPAAGRVAKSAAAPGVDSILLSVVDVAPGSAVDASDVVLALSVDGLSIATAGAPLDLGTAINSGINYAVAIYIRLVGGTNSVISDEISLSVSTIAEFAA